MSTKLGKIIADGLREFADDVASDKSITSKYNCRRVIVDLHPQAYTGQMVKETRTLLDASQAVFALVLGVSVRTLQKWEQGEQEPSPIACRFMDEIRAAPDHFQKRMLDNVRSKSSTNCDDENMVTEVK